MERALPTTKYSAHIIPVQKRIRDPRDAIGRIRNRTRNIHPIFHHAKVFVRIVVGVTFITTSGYVMSYPHQAQRSFDRAVAYVSHISAQEFVAAVGDLFVK